MVNDTTSPSIPLDPGWGDIREGVGRICEGFPNGYWVKLDHEAAYPTEFVEALTEAGYLSALIPEEYGGSGLPLSAACAVLETIHDSPCNAAACHAQMYTMGAVLRHGSEAVERRNPSRHHVGDQLREGVAVQRLRARQQFVERDAEAVDVGRRPERPVVAVQLLGSGVDRRAGEAARVRLPLQQHVGARLTRDRHLVG